MSLSAKHRSALYQGLSSVVDDPEAIEEMLGNFPAVPDEQPISRQFLRAELATFRTELHAEIGGLRTELQTEVGGLRAEVHAGTQRLIMWVVGTNISLFALLFVLLRATS